MRQRLEPSIPLLLAVCLLGCAEPRRATFEITFARPALAARAVRAEVSVLAGGCRGATLHEDVFDVRSRGAPVAPLRPGTYGFRARISDATCAVYAEGCTQKVLPADDLHVVVVVAERAPLPGRCETVSDASAPLPEDAGARDAEPVDAAPDAGPDREPDAGSGVLVPTHVPPSLVEAGAAELVVRASDAVVVLDTDDGALFRLSDRADRRPAGLVVTVLPQLGGAPDLTVLSLRALHVEAGAELRVVGSAALVLAVRDEARIEGRLDADADGRAPGPGGFAGGALVARAGAGPGGGRAGPDAQDVGGGGGGHGAAGGAGGDIGGALGGAGGAPVDAALVRGGSGGAAGGGTNAPGNGGGGGGAVVIVAERIVVETGGAIDCAGGGGQGGALDDGGGGGGAGGRILLEAREIEVRGALVANGGGGGAGADVGRRGADGETGPADERAARGGAQRGEGARGGAGGATGAPAGGAGGSATGGGLDNGGGGGGAGGRIHLRGERITTEGAVISPRETTTQAGL